MRTFVSHQSYANVTAGHNPTPNQPENTTDIANDNLMSEFKQFQISFQEQLTAINTQLDNLKRDAEQRQQQNHQQFTAINQNQSALAKAFHEITHYFKTLNEDKTNNANTQSPQRKIPRRNQNSQDDTEMNSATEPGRAVTLSRATSTHQGAT